MKKVFSTDYRMASFYDFEKWLKEEFKEVIDEEAGIVKRERLLLSLLRTNP